MVKVYEEYEGLTALEPIQTLFNGLMEKDMLYLESGHLLGKLSLRQEDSERVRSARAVLFPLSDYQAGLPDEKIVHLWCGQLYGRSFLECRQYKSAKEVLEPVERDQPGIFREDSPEADQVRKLLKHVRNKPKEKPQRRRGCFLRRSN